MNRRQANDKVLVINAPIGMYVIEFRKVAKAEITVMDMNERA